MNDSHTTRKSTLCRALSTSLLGLAFTASTLGAEPPYRAKAPTTAPTPVPSTNEADAVLAKERWREMSYGISLRPPLGSRLQSRTIDDAVVRIQKDDDYSITLYIKTLRQDMTIDQVVRTSIEQFGFSQPTAIIDHQSVAKPAGRPGWLIYFGINLPAREKPQAERDVQAMMQVSRTQLETANRLREKQGQDIAAFRLYKSIAMNSPDKAVAKKAKEWVAAYEVDRQFMQRYLIDEAARRQRNPLDVDTRGWYMGQAFMQLAPNVFVVAQLEVGQDAYPKVRPIFEEVIKSLEVQNPKELDEMRKVLIERGDEFAQGLNHKRLVESMLPEVTVPIVDEKGNPAGAKPLRLQYVRVMEGGKDVGWMKTVHRERHDQIVTIDTKEELDVKTGRTKIKRTSQVTESGVLGIGVDVYARIHFGPRAVDSHSQTFLSQDGEYESWSIRTTVRDRSDPDPGAKAKPASDKLVTNPKAAAPQPMHHVRTWLETGVQNKEQITIIREGPTGIDRVNWRRPSKGYITQTELYLLAPLLPQNNSERGFYAYYPNNGTISFRSMRIVSDGSSGGGFRIYTRPSLDSAEQVSDYDGEKRLLRKALGEGRDVIPTTREALAKIWNVDLPDETAVPARPEDDKPLPPTGRIPR